MLLVPLFALQAKADLIEHMGLGGATKLGAEKEAGAIFRVIGDFAGDAHDFEETYFGKFDISLASGGFGEVDFADITFVTISQGADVEGNVAGHWLPLKYRKDLAIDLDTHFSVSLVEIVGSGAYEMDAADLDFVIGGALDILGYGYSRRASDQSSDEGWNSSVEGMFGFQNKKFRLVFGGSITQVFGSSKLKGYQLDCELLFDDAFCDLDPVYDRDIRYLHEAYVNLKYRLSDHLELFGELAYHGYEVASEVTGSPRSDESITRFVFGAIYTPHPNERYIRDKNTLWIELK